jgi:hypothetical protein
MQGMDDAQPIAARARFVLLFYESGGYSSGMQRQGGAAGVTE